MSKLFCEFKQESEIITNFYDENKEKFDTITWNQKPLARNIYRSISEKEEIEKDNTGMYYGFHAIEIKKSIWKREPLLELVNEKFPIMMCGILKVKANSIYDWHVDTERGVCINMLLSFDHLSECIFSHQKNITELKYKPNKFYLFNNQILHKVKNFDAPRYLFSLQFQENKTKLTYEMIYNWAKKMELI